MKNIVYILLLFSVALGAQTTSESYVKSVTPQKEIIERNVNEDAVITNADKIETVTYYDGLGRPKQSVALRAGGNSSNPSDIITHIEYDTLGRVSKEYLPFAIEQSNNGNLYSNPIPQIGSFYDTAKYENTKNPYAETVYELSPLNRVLEQAAPGNDWRYDPDNFEYENPVYQTVTITPDNYQNIFSHWDFIDDDSLDPELITDDAKISIENGILKLDMDYYFSFSSSTTITTGVIKSLTINPPINYLDLGFIKKATATGQIPTKYKFTIENNDLIITDTDGSNEAVSQVIFHYEGSVSEEVEELVSYDAKYSKNHTIRFDYGSNVENEVKKFKVNFSSNNLEEPSLQDVGFYENNQLYKTVVKDENWQPEDGKLRTTEEFKDKQGRIVLKRTHGTSSSIEDTGTAHDTYYVYDELSNLTFVISPKVTISNGVDQTELAELCYQYKYDERNRLIKKKIPGKGWESIVYNTLDRPVLTQDPNQAAKPNKEWLFTKYDVFGRVAYTGIYQSNASRETLQQTINNGDYPSYEKRIQNTSSNLTTFTNLVGIEVSGDNITKTASFGTDNGAAATNQSIVADGYISFSFPNPSQMTSAGLSIANSDANLLNIKYGLVTIFGNVAVVENGTILNGIYPFQPTDILKVEREGQIISYKRNDEVIYTSTIPSTGNLVGDFGIQQNGGSIENIALVNTTSSAITIDQTEVYYQNLAFPTTTDSMKMLTIHYYDDYTFNLGDFNYPGMVMDQVAIQNPKGLATGSFSKVLGGNHWIKSVTYYDEKSRPVYVASENTYLQTVDIVKTKFDFTGKVLKTNSKHRKQETGIEIKERYTYDHMGRQKAQLHSINNQKEVLIAEHFYDELGQLEKKEVGGSKANISTTLTDFESITTSENTVQSIGNSVGGFATQESITGDGYIELIVTENTGSIAIGLSSSNLDQTALTIAYGIEIKPSIGRITIRESVSSTGFLITEEILMDDAFRVERYQGVIRYYHNDALLYTSETPSTTALIGDGSLTGTSFLISNLKLVDAQTQFTNQPLQTVDYKYNVRGWLTDINDVDVPGDDLFTFKINYNKTSDLFGNSVDNGALALYNGNINSTVWKTANDHIKRAYGYAYDGLNRIKGASDLDNKYDLSNIQYDKNGNLILLLRDGNLGGQNYGMMDYLLYGYKDNGNQLMLVQDISGQTNGFNDGNLTGVDYEYDSNGNLTIDRNKGIAEISYNHLNLPNFLEFNSSDKEGEISYVYDATGSKLKKFVDDHTSGISSFTEYAGNYIYQSGSGGNNLKFFNHPEGYIEPENDGSFTYIWQYKDHLGNIRLSYADTNRDGHIDVLRNNIDVDGDGDGSHEIREEKNYYPFGLEHRGYNSTITGRKHNYGFGGKEFTEELDFNTYDFGLRNYDPSIGRWFNIDPKADATDLVSSSSFSYALNNPITFIDPQGDCPPGIDCVGIAVRVKIGFNSFKKAVSSKISNANHIATGMIQTFDTASKSTGGGGISKFAKAKIYASRYVKEFGSFTGANDGSVLLEGQNLDGSKASKVDYGFAAAAILLPISGSSLKNLFKSGSKADNLLEYSIKGADDIGNAKLSDKGVLQLDFSVPEGMRGQGVGTAMFDDALKTFGDDVKGIEGLWGYGSDGKASDNLKSFLGNVDWMGGSMSREDAAFNTITGRWAKKNGYTNVSINYDDADEVKVLFTKPNN